MRLQNSGSKMEILIYRNVKPVGLEAIGSESKVRHLFLMYL